MSLVVQGPIAGFGAIDCKLYGGSSAGIASKKPAVYAGSATAKRPITPDVLSATPAHESRTSHISDSSSRTTVLF